MVILDMIGPFPLSEKKIDEVVTEKSPGNYALGFVNDEKTFNVQYVGRSDTDVNKRLKDWVKKYNRFKFSYVSSSKAAFEKECKNYHDFGEDAHLDNDKHPDRPKGKDWECPVCD